MANKTYTTTFALGGQLNPTFSKTFGRAQQQVEKLDATVKNAKMGKQFNAASNSVLSFRSSLGGIARVAGAAAIAIGGISAVASGLGKAMDFEAQVDAVASLDSSLKKGTKGYADMQKLALKLGASTSYSAMEAAKGMEELVKAGMPVQTMLNGGAEAALNLAAGGGVEVSEAAEVMAVALNTFKKDGMQAADAANILAGTANAAATGVVELRYGIAAVGTVAAGMGLDFRDTASAIGLFTNNGMQAADAGTSLKSMLMNLQPSTKAQRQEFLKLGLITKGGANAFFDANGQIKDMASIAGILQKSMKNLTSQQRAATLEIMFGSDAIRAGNILFEEGAKGVQNFQATMGNTTALEAAKARMDNAKGAVEQFKGAMETLQISILMPLMPTIKKVALAAADFGGRLTEALDSDAAKTFGKQTRSVFGIVKKAIITAYQAVLPVAKSIMGNLSGLFDTWIASAKPLIPSIRSVIMSVISIIRQVIPVVLRIGSTLGPIASKIMQVLIPIVGYISGKVWPIIAQIFQFLATQVFPKITAMIIALLPRISAIGDKMVAAFQAIWSFVKPIIDGLVAAFQFAFPFIKSIVLNTVDTIGGVIRGLMTVFGGVLDFITGVFSGNWSKAWHGILDIFSGIFSTAGSILAYPINVAIDAINTAIRGINKVNIDVPDWVPGIGGESFGINIPEIPKIATYARGGFAKDPSIFGEAGLEVAIPIDGSERSRSLYEATGRLLGSGGGTTNNTSSSDTFVYHQTININGSADKATVEQAVKSGQADFEKQMTAWQQRRKRVSMAT